MHLIIEGNVVFRGMEKGKSPLLVDGNINAHLSLLHENHRLDHLIFC